MQESVCSQCNKSPRGHANRIVRDSCGHEKCRVCLLEDEDHCKLCLKEQFSKSGSAIDKVSQYGETGYNLNGEAYNEILINNHTAVIQLNGNVSSNNFNGENTLTSKINNSLENISETFKERSSEQNQENSLKEENKNITSRKVKKPDKEKKRLYNSIDIPKHITVNSNPLSYHCTICDKSFITKTHIKYHSYCAGAAKPYKCEICSKEFILRAQLDVHSYKHKPNKPYTCTICKKSFSIQSKLSRHSAVHSVVKSHICSVCGNAYRSKESLKIHLIIHKGEKPYGCKFCTARFSNQSNLNKHSTVHSKEKSHMCDQCGKRFKLKWTLTVHRRSHLRTRPHECRVCLKTFVNNKDLQRHCQIHAGTKPYMCSICSISFPRQDNLRRHMKNAHPGKKGEVIKNVVSPPSDNTCTEIKKTPIDNPNAINVITTASPAFASSSKAEVQAVVLPPFVKSDCRAGEQTATGVINGPIKLAFKTSAFKSSYNINRDFNYVSNTQCQSTYDMAESVDICQKILTSDSSILQRNVACKAEPTSQEICQKILDPNSRPLHYETSFQNKKHAMIKNIKFKVPAQYTSNFSEREKEKPVSSESKTYAELKPVAVTSVIVNNNNVGNSNDLGQLNNMHWRRRTLQNLGLKN
ncbi:hypothetical protein JTB14_034386 [Gonioctena quinquepunctata]|nr:hypothetical protein JTB14_034386 [Gonioctena quinquepunctata]